MCKDQVPRQGKPLQLLLAQGLLLFKQWQLAMAVRANVWWVDTQVEGFCSYRTERLGDAPLSCSLSAGL